MSEKLFIELINKLKPETLSQEIVSGLYILLFDSVMDKEIKQAAYNKLNEWKSYKRKHVVIMCPAPDNSKAKINNIKKA